MCGSAVVRRIKRKRESIRVTTAITLSERKTGLSGENPKLGFELYRLQMCRRAYLQTHVAQLLLVVSNDFKRKGESILERTPV